MKILASDLDGTLYFGREIGIKKADALAIKQFQKDGNLFGLCSGRTLVGVHDAIDGLDIDLDFMILVSGAMIVDKNENYLYCHRIPRDLAIRIVDSLQQYKPAILLCRDEHYYRINSQKTDIAIEIIISDPREMREEDLDSIHLRFEDMDELLKVKAFLETEFKGEIEVYHNVLNLDITPFGQSKGNACHLLEKLYHVRKEDIFSIGDSFNDISMLESTDTSFTFHTSPEQVKSKATHIVNNIKEAIEIINSWEE